MLSSDTDLTPFDVGAYASSTTFITGGSVKKAGERVVAQLLAASRMKMTLAAAASKEEHVGELIAITDDLVGQAHVQGTENGCQAGRGRLQEPETTGRPGLIGQTFVGLL